MRSLGAFWVYTLLRFALFFVLWAILWLVGVPTLFAGFIALAVSVPLSWFLLARPRRAFAASIEQRVDHRRERTHDLDAKLAGAPVIETPDSDYAPGVSEAPSRNLRKRR